MEWTINSSPDRFFWSVHVWVNFSFSLNGSLLFTERLLLWSHGKKSWVCLKTKNAVLKTNNPVLTLQRTTADCSVWSLATSCIKNNPKDQHVWWELTGSGTDPQAVRSASSLLVWLHINAARDINALCSTQILQGCCKSLVYEANLLCYLLKEGRKNGVGGLTHKK